MLESVLVSLDGREDLANAIIESMVNNPKIRDMAELNFVNVQKFSDGELCVDFKSTVRGKRVYILTSPNSSDEIMKLNLAIDAAKRGAAKEIIPIIPYFPYQRSDKKDQKRGPIAAKIVAEMIEQRGATGVITFDLHADQIQGFFNIPVTHIEGKNIFDSYIAEIYDADTILCGPDAGSSKRVKRMSDQLKIYHGISCRYVMMDKTRGAADEVEEMFVIGDVKGKNVIIIDDMTGTASTLCMASEILLEEGAKSVRAIVSHGVLSGGAYTNLYNSKLTELVVSDSLETKPSTMIKIISIAKQISLAVGAINSHSSYEGLKKEVF